MTMELTSIHFARVGVCVEVDETERSITVCPGEAGSVPIRDRVVPAEDNGNRSGGGDLFNGIGEGLEAKLEIARRNCDVANVDHGEFGKRIDPGGQVRPVHVRWKVVRFPDGFGPEAGAASIRGAPIDRGTDDHDIGILILDSVERRHRNTAEAGERRESVYLRHVCILAQPVPVCQTAHASGGT
jgi:hypothetical protein